MGTDLSTATPQLAAEPCRGCGSGLDTAQRYCVRCGTRCGPAPEELLRALGFDRPRPAPTPAARPERPPRFPHVAALLGAAATGQRDRFPRAAAALAAAGLIAGLTVGALASPDQPASIAATPQRIFAIDAPAPTSAASSQPPTEAAASPTDGAPSPTNADAAPTDSDTTPTDADTTPTDADATPTDAGAPPTSGDASPTDTGSPTPAAPPTGTDDDASTPAVPSIAHVWIIRLAALDLRPAFAGDSPAPYLGRFLASKGTVLEGYTPLPGGPADDVALLSGRAPTPATTGGCPAVADCAYPAGAQSLADQVAAVGGTWRAYVEGDSADCPAPFAYFASLAGACSATDAGATGLGADLADPAKTPTLSWIAEAETDDLAAADLFLRHVLPAIRATAAYKDGGLVVIVPRGRPPVAQAAAPAGALVLSPHARAGKRAAQPVGPYSLLGTLEDVLGVQRLEHAASVRTTSLAGLLDAKASSDTTTTTTTGRSA